MRFWLTTHSSIPIRQQLATQITLGVLTGDLPAGHRLPSTRDLARRFHVHANTVSGAYRELEKAGWLEFRHGSGVFVRKSKPSAKAGKDGELERLFAQFLRLARKTNASVSDVRSHVRQWLAMQPPDHFLLIEPDEELRAIVLHEISKVVDLPVLGAGFDACSDKEKLSSAALLVMAGKAEVMQKTLPNGKDCIILHARSVAGSLQPWMSSRKDLLLGVVSRWPGFLDTARTMLVAFGFQAESLVLRDARKSGWKQALQPCDAVICDSLMASAAPKSWRVLPFNLLADESIEELRKTHADLIAP